MSQKSKTTKLRTGTSFSFADLFRRLVLAWITAVTIECSLLTPELRSMDNLSGLAEMSLLRLLIITCGITYLLFEIPDVLHPACLERWLTVLNFTYLSYLTVQTDVSNPFTGVLLCIIAAMSVYAACGNRQDALSARRRDILHVPGMLLVILCALTFVAFVGGWGLSRILSFGGSTYDVGIFAQMFHSMKATGLPMTTLERGYLLSHFAVHVSPIYYLLLPFYCLVPGAHTLNLLQALILASAVIPLWKLCRSHGLSALQSVLLCLLLLAAPAYAGGTSYDFHENAFLTPLLLWLFYGIRKKNTAFVAVFAILTLLVKEDAAVYVAVTALWLLVDSLLKPKGKRRWGVIAGGCMLIFSVAYFLGCVSYLSAYGDGVMTYRYNNLMFDGSGSLMTVVKAAILSPLKVLYECADQEKIPYIVMTLGTLLGLPLLTRRYQRCILLIPYLLINLISDYSYQHNILFQYSFGSLAFLMYLTLINLADLKGKWKRILPLIAAVLISIQYTHKEVVPTAEYYINRYMNNQSFYQEQQAALNEIPADASVAATTYMTVPLSQRAEVYDITYAEPFTVLTADYVVIQCNDTFSLRKYATESSIGYQELVALLVEHGYELSQEFGSTFVVYKNMR